MRLHRLRVENFKGVEERELSFPDRGVTLVSGRNEVGKTSMIEAFDLLVAYRHGSKAAKVREARPIGTELGVTVEAEFTINEERVWVSRTWLKGAGTQLQFISGPRRGEKLAGDQACDALEQLWNEHDTTLWAASRLMQATGLDQQALDGSASLARALEAAAGGEAFDAQPNQDLLARVREEADRYFTGAKRDPKGDYKKALDAVAATRTARDEAVKRLRELDAVRDDYEQVTLDLKFLDDKVKAARAECAGLTARKDEVDAAKQAHDQARQHHSEALLAGERALQKRSERDELVRKLAENSQRAEGLQQRLDDQHAALAPISEQLKAAEEQLRVAEGVVQQAEQVLDQAHRDRNHLSDKAELDRLETQLGRLTELRHELAGLEAATDSPLTEDLVDQVNQAHADWIGCQARLEAASARVRVRAPESGGQIQVGDASTMLGAGQVWQHPVTEALRLELPGAWQVEVLPGAGDGLQDQAETAQARLDELLAEAQADGIEQLRVRWTRLTRARAELVAATSARDQLLAGGDEAGLLDQAEQLRTRVDGHARARNRADGTLAGSAEQAAEAIQLAEHQRSLAQDARTGRAATVEELRADRDKRNTSISDLTGELRALEQQISADAQALALARAEHDDQAVADQAQAAEQAIQEAEAKLQQCEGRLAELDAEQVLTQAADAQANLEGLSEQLADVREKRSGLVGRLNAMNADLLQREADQAETAHEQANRIAQGQSRKARAALRLETTLLAHQERAQLNYVEPFRAVIAEYGRSIYADPGFDVRVDSDLQVSARLLKGEWIDFDALSTGAKEQLVILIRLAAAQLVNPDDRVPVLLDDALGYSDQQRLRRMWSALGRAGEHSQVILMTANPERYAGMRQLASIEL